MRNKTLVIGIIIIIIIGGMAIIALKNNSQSKPFTGDAVQSHRLYTLQSDPENKIYALKTPSEYAFSIVDDQGNTLKDFAVTHTKLMHVIVVRRDLAYFQHIHPEFDQATGMFTFKDLTFPADGLYRIFADFAPGGGQKDVVGMSLPVTLSEDVLVGVGANYILQALGSEEKVKTFSGYQVFLNTQGTPRSGAESMLMFSLSQNGKSVTDLQEYLGALGHAVVLRESTLDFIHAHSMEDINRPQTGEVGFMVDFPEAGKYKVFTQFQRNGKVFTTDFVVSVAKGTNGSDSMPIMDH